MVALPACLENHPRKNSHRRLREAAIRARGPRPAEVRGSVAPVAGARQLTVVVVVQLDTTFGIDLHVGGRGIIDRPTVLVRQDRLVERIADVAGVLTVGHAGEPFHPHGVVEIGELMRNVHEAVDTRAVEAAHVRHGRAQVTGIRTVRDFHFPMLFGEDPIAEMDSIHSWI